MSTIQAPYPWQQPLLDTLTSLLREGRCSHALLLHGEQGVGQLALAHQLVPLILCRALQQGEHTSETACPCCTWIQSGSHPDFLSLSTEKSSIGIDEVRQVISFMNQTPSMPAGVKVVLVQDVDKLTPAAANALLKSVEEPAGHGLWLFTTEKRHLLLPTLLSRTLSLPVTASQNDTLAWIEPSEYTPAEKRRAVQWAPYAPLVAQAFLESGASAHVVPLWSDLKAVYEGRTHVWSFASTWKDNFDEVFRLILLSLKERLLKATSEEAKVSFVTQSQRVLKVQALHEVPGSKSERLIAMALLLTKETS